jgi:phosphoserine phosphatase
MSEIENAYAAGAVTNADVAAMDARHYRGLTPAGVSAMLDDIPVIDDIVETVEWLSARGIPAVICTLAWKFVGEVFAERYGFVASSGPTLRLGPNGEFTGEVESDFTEYDKPAFIRSLCATLGVGMVEVFHIGDSRSDIPLFEAVGYSVALNASQQASEAASTTLQADSLLDILEVIPGLKAQPGAG